MSKTGKTIMLVTTIRSSETINAASKIIYGASKTIYGASKIRL
jgi:hypothetical protein